MITFFTIPKPFRGHIGIIQRNAIRSWTLLRPTCEIILCGDDEGTAETAAEFGTRHIPDVARNEYGTPLVNDIFAKAQRLASHDLVCYINSDVILMHDFLTAISRVRWSRFLTIGQRWDLDLKEPLDFGHAEWDKRLLRRVHKEGALHSPRGIDYSLFSRGAIGELPPFAVGRPAWDNWLIYHARALGMPVVDATSSIVVIHQNHDYGHVKKSRGDRWEGPEADHNRALAGGWLYRFSLRDATWRLTPRRLMPALTWRHLCRRWEVWPFLHLPFRFHAPIDRLWGIIRSPRRVPLAILRRIRHLLQIIGNLGLS